jgi:hypothetical protein
MSAPFEALEETLLRGGIAPRHVKRYLRELDEHLSDITEAKAAAGQAAPTATTSARAVAGGAIAHPVPVTALGQPAHCGPASWLQRDPGLVQLFRRDYPQRIHAAFPGCLVGVWHGALGQSVFGGLFGNLTGMTPMKLGQMVLVYCRIAPAEDELEMSCHQFGKMGRVTIADGLVRIGGSRITFEGEQPDVNTLRGRYRSRSWLGLSKDNPAVAEAVRVVPQADAPDTTGNAALLRQILEQGLAAVPQDAEGLKKNRSNLTLPMVGPVQSLSYLGQESRWDWPPPPGTRADIMNLPNRPDFFSVYWVRFAAADDFEYR